MHLTLRDLPPRLETAIRERAQRENKSHEQVALEAMLRGIGMHDGPVQQQRNLDGIAGTWEEDPSVAAALESQRLVDPDLWR